MCGVFSRDWEDITNKERLKACCLFIIEKGRLRGGHDNSHLIFKDSYRKDSIKLVSMPAEVTSCSFSVTVIHLPVGKCHLSH